MIKFNCKTIVRNHIILRDSEVKRVLDENLPIEVTCDMRPGEKCVYSVEEIKHPVDINANFEDKWKPEKTYSLYYYRWKS